MSLGIQPEIDSLGQRRRESLAQESKVHRTWPRTVSHSLTGAESDVKLSSRVMLVNGKEPKPITC